MKSKVFLSGSILVALFVFGSWTYRSLEDKDAVVIRLIMQGLSSSHYVAVDVDDAFSNQAYDLYLSRLDYNKRFLLQSDIDDMNRFKYRLDNEAEMGTYDFFDLSVGIIEKRIDEAQKYYREALSKPFDFSIEEEIEMDTDKTEYAGSEAEMEDRWRKSMKYLTLNRLHNMMQKQEKDMEKEDATEEIKTFEEMEETARERVLKNYDDYFHRLNKLEKRDRRSDYINALTSTFDPHTTYFPPKDKEDFDITMSGQLEGIGATLTEQNDYIKVNRIVPGSPSAKQGQLKAEDLILKVGQEDNEPVDVVGMRLDDAVRLIRGKKGTTVKLTVQKPDGEVIIVPILRDVVKLEATYARSLLLDDDPKDGKYGYIKLPSFYTDFSRRGGPSCSDDVAKEIEKLKEQNVQGLILDLRNNGGGSLPDVVDMAGLFIEDGPIVQVKSRRGAPYVLEDEDSRIQFDGPLVVMVNTLSASASEIMAAAIQDYKRGIIIGSPSTYGKGTVQSVYNLDDFLRNKPDLYPMGSIKLTTQKFYRINGGATQQKGVIPDIILPDTYSYLDVGEKEYENSMPWDEISSVDYTSWVKTGVFYDRAIKKSASRTEANPIFAQLNENALRYQAQRERTAYPLNLDAYRALRKEEKAKADKYKDIMQPIPGFQVENMEVDLAKIQSDSSKMEINKDWIENVEKDPYLYEAVQVLKDL